jgi:hypothetical protein
MPSQGLALRHHLLFVHLLCAIASSNFSHLVAWKGKIVSQMIAIIFLGGFNSFSVILSFLFHVHM